MDLNKILRGSGGKRNALAAIRTVCRFCFKPFLDKWYDEPTHKVICPWCGKNNATLSSENKIEVLIMGLRHDIGVQGVHGVHLQSFKQIIKLLKKEYGDLWNKKLQEILDNFEITQEMFKEWLKKRKIQNPNPKIL